MAKLVGTGPKQVPTNADLGTLAYQDNNNVKLGDATLTGDITSTGGINIKTTDANGTGIALGLDGDKKVRFYDDQGATTKMYWNASTATQKFEDNSKLAFGSSEDLKLYHDGTDNKLVGDVVQTGKLTTDATDLSALAATISDTAVDVFVYDTRKDSDGGAWRKRTQHTSWYNETLNTATRGSRKEFPSVAVIVAETNQVTIYDGDDPDLPMWMVFNQGSGQHLGSTSLTLTALVATNGGIYVTYTSGSFGYHQLNFLKDASFFHNSNGVAVRSLPILNRNEQNSSTVINTNGVLNAAHNDVAMTVLPNAPIDAATGLPVPTIAVATDGGVSVIKDDGTVVDYYTSSASWAKTKNVEFYNNEEVVFTTWSGSSFSRIGWKIPLRSSDISLNEWEIDAASYTNVFTGRTGSNVVVPNQIENSNILELSTSRDFIHLGCDNGLTKYDFKGAANNITNSVAYISTDYNTGWMNGDIKLATLSDTDDTDVTGSELVTNGDFATSSDWSLPTGFSISGGELLVSGASAYIKATQNITTEIGKTYVYTLDVTSTTTITGLWRMYVQSVSGGTNTTLTYAQLGGVGTYKATFTATTTMTEVSVYCYSGTNNGSFDNASVRIAEKDRSVIGNGLQVFGTVTKNPVSSGADLVAYSGFSASNYLEQPYNSDLDFGTGDFSIITWAKTNGSVNNNQTLFNTGYYSGSTWEYWIALQILGSNGNIRFATAENGNFTTEDAAVDADTGTWICIVAVRRNGVLEVYKDGVFLSSESGTIRDLTIDGNAKSRIGLQLDDGSTSAADDTSIALTRISATAPSPEQIARIYNDEKHLFTEGAQATLYGSSDSVTALAFDDTTNLLHVGTSAGRSVFQGLRRVDNTTTAVTSAISASNGLVADE